MKRIRIAENIRDQIARTFPVEQIVGNSPAFLEALADALRAAETDEAVLITGESGTGKELLARIIHAASRRSPEPFIPVHCAALPRTQMDAVLFGKAPPAGEGSRRSKPGQIDLVGSGTLFFDEVDQLDPSLQTKLLHVLNQGEFLRNGGRRRTRTGARIMAASNAPLDEAVKAGHFKDDLLRALRATPLHLPPLRQRSEDIPTLARHCLARYRRLTGAAAEDFSPDALQRLGRYAWPGNIRELRNVIERTLVLHSHHPLIRTAHLPPELQEDAETDLPLDGTHTLTDAVNDFERKLVEQALLEADGVQTRAAQLLGTTRRVLKYRMEKLNISAS